MEWYHVSLILAFIVAAVVGKASGLPRALLWVGSLAAAYGASVLYLYAPKPVIPGVWWPPASGVAMLCDAMVCLIIYWHAQRSWETRGLYKLMLGSGLVNLAYLTLSSLEGLGIWFIPPPPPRWLYGSILEAINYAALLLIGGSAILRRIGGADGYHFSRRTVAPVRAACRAFLKAHRPSDTIRQK